VTAFPGLNQFHLYRPRYTPPIANGTDTFCVALTGGNQIKFKPGDRILVGVLRPSGGSLEPSQILIVDKTWESFGTLFVKTKGVITALSGSSGAPTSAKEMRAYKLGATFHHFGHNATTKQMTAYTIGTPVAKIAYSITNTTFARTLNGTITVSADLSIEATQMPLDGKADGVSAGGTLLADVAYGPTQNSSTKRVIARQIRAVDQRSLIWGPMSGDSTVLTLDQSLALTEPGEQLNQADIRAMTFHQVDGGMFTLTAALQPVPSLSGPALDFYGTGADAVALNRRTLLLVGPGGDIGEANVLAVASGPGSTAAAPVFHCVTLDRNVAYGDYDHDQPVVTVYGNLVAASEGKTEDEVTLGGGDAREIFQTFALPKPPLTYLLDPEHEPPHKPELSIYVDGRLWRRVDVLFGSGPRDSVYIVREDDSGKSFVQFGDGKTGARLPSGRGNIVARFRTGSGSTGPLKKDTKPQPAARLPGLDKVYMPEPAVGGAAPEDEKNARAAAPTRMQALGRVVSLADLEAEAKAIAGVIKARAAWEMPENASPHVVVTVLTLSRNPADENPVADSLRKIYLAHGPARYPITVVQGSESKLAIQAIVGCDPTYRQEDIRAGVLEALGAASPGRERNHGLFSWQQRQLGQSAHGSQIVVAIQNVPGAAWAKISYLGLTAPPSVLAISPSSSIGATAMQATLCAIACPSDGILALDESDLVLSLARADVSGGP
jgi:hypothetical protein